MPELWDFNDLVERGGCVFCGLAWSPPVAQRADGLSLRECAACGLAYIDPRPSSRQIKDYYNSDYFSGGKDFFHGVDYCAARDQAITQTGVTGYAEIVAGIDLAGKNVLDIGCASGALLHSLRPHGPRHLVGLDIAEYPLAYGRERYGLDLRQGFLETAKLPDGYFDLVTMIDVIEHVEDLPAFMRALRRVVKTGGQVFLLTPNYASFFCAGAKWRGLGRDFEHLHYLSPQSLEQIAKSTGFNMLRWWTRGIPVELESYPQWLAGGAHRWRYPHISARNAWRQLAHRYRARSMAAASGYELLAILRATPE